MSDHLVRTRFGYYGKVPERGDFIQDQLSVGFIESWNEWLQATLAVSREQLGESWLDCYLTSPVWHFALSGGVCGDSVMVGTLMPSVDKVGRHFYFTLAAEVELPPIAFWEQRQWSEEAEEQVLKILDDETDLMLWADSLNKKDWFEENHCFGAVIKQMDTEQSNQLILETDDTLQSVHLLHQAYREIFGRYCLWWTSGSERIPACTLVTSGLPLVGQFSAMLDGNWEKWGW